MNHEEFILDTRKMILELRQLDAKRTIAQPRQLQSPDGLRFPPPDHIRSFARTFQLDASNLCKLLKGKLKSHKGWTLV